jgi:metal-responsive CopG/Arc/MetJ family transcriptional regulator
MPTEKPIINFAIDKDLLTRIDDFRFGNRINTRSEAVRLLVEEGLKALDPSRPTRRAKKE